MDCASTNKVLAKRGRKYVEVVQNTSLSATSVMFSGSAAGEMLPPVLCTELRTATRRGRRGGPRGQATPQQRMGGSTDTSTRNGSSKEASRMQQSLMPHLCLCY